MNREDIIKRLKELNRLKREAEKGTVCHYWRVAAKYDGEITKLIDEL